ncbi:hypothetical protein PANT111_100200 [Pantoea brenneri]|uniref:Uncharacterized protein n=1 Tax=Pantoea brenneri TaxID=472694 RepID=A0AAX3J366_9GAMM|nr:hypothetical protein PANT111_100200 [Pantoea brenneri]
MTDERLGIFNGHYRSSLAEEGEAEVRVVAASGLLANAVSARAGA